PAAAPADEGRRERIRLEVVAGEPAGGDEAFEDVSEADEKARADEADDLARERALPAALEELRLEQPREAELIGEVLDLRRLALAERRVLGEPRQVVGRRVVGGAE